MARRNVICAIDPGPERSAFAVLDGENVCEFGWPLSADLLLSVRMARWDRAIIEGVYSRNQIIGKSTIDTIRWCARYFEALDVRGIPVEEIDNDDVRIHHCGECNAKDKALKQILIDRYGGDLKATRGQRCPTCNDGFRWETGNCLKCAGEGRVPGKRPGTMRKCECNAGKIRYREPCTDCNGTRWIHPPGPLAGMNEHVLSALAAGLVLVDRLARRKETA